MTSLLSSKYSIFALILVQVLGACCCWAEAECCDAETPEAVLVIQCQPVCEEHGSCIDDEPATAASRTSMDLFILPSLADYALVSQPLGLSLTLPHGLNRKVHPAPLAGVTILRC